MLGFTNITLSIDEDNQRKEHESSRPLRKMSNDLV